MDYRIIISGIVILFFSITTAYRDYQEDIFLEFEGKLVNKEKKIEIVKTGRHQTTQYNTYLYLQDITSPFIHREFKKELANRYWPSFIIGKSTKLYIHKDTGLIWGMAREGVLVLNPRYKQKNKFISHLWVCLFGFTLLFVGLFFTKIKGFFQLGYKYS